MNNNLIDKITNISPFESFDNLINNSKVNPMSYDFKLNALNDNFKFQKKSDEITYIDFMFDYNRLEAVDRDRCSLARDFYRKVFGCDTSNKAFSGKHDCSYDTINTFQTTYQQAIKIYCPNLFKNCKLGNIQVDTNKNTKISREWLTKVHLDLLEKSNDYRALNSLEYLQQFAHWTHTIGNFTLIPFYYRTKDGYIVALNARKGCDANIRDYFDLSVSAIYDAYHLMKRISNTDEKEDFKINYVDKFHLEDYFVFLGDYKPTAKILFTRNNNKVLPQTREELKSCILEMIIRIIERGKKITCGDKCSKAFNNFMEEKQYEELLNSYRECRKIDLCDNCNEKCMIKKSYIEFTKIHNLIGKTKTRGDINGSI